MARVSRALPPLLLHVNLLLMLFAGAMLAMAARLKWDPSAYIAARELFPREYISAAVALPIIGFTLVVLAHLAIIALRLRVAARRVLLIFYATVMGISVWCEAWWGAWLAVRIRRWVLGPSATDLRQTLKLGDDLQPLLQHLAHFHPLPEKINKLMQEAQNDLPKNVYVMAAACGTLLVLQVLAVALALGAGLANSNGVSAPRRPRSPAHSITTTYTPVRYTVADLEFIFVQEHNHSSPQIIILFQVMKLFAGAMLAMAARLKWDPTAYIAARELFPREYISAAVALPTIGFTLVVLAHLAIIALRLRVAARRVLLVFYATVMGISVWCEAWWGAWLAVRIRRWVLGPSATDLRQTLKLGDDLQPLLQHLAHFHPLPEKINKLMQEAQSDLPKNVYVMAAACGTLLVLQVLAVALALGAGLANSNGASAPRRPRSPAHSITTTYTPVSMRRGEDKVRTTYKSGRLVVV